MKKQRIYNFPLSFFYLKGWLIGHEDQMLLLFPEFVNIVSVLFDNFIEIIIILYNHLVICFARYKDYMILRISFSMFSEVLPALTCLIAIGYLF